VGAVTCIYLGLFGVIDKGPLSVLFAYDAIAYYMWQLNELKSHPKLNSMINDGEKLGIWARGTTCKYGT